MLDSIQVMAGAGLVAFTIFVIALHVIEWFQIVELRRLRLANDFPSAGVSSKSSMLKGELGVEIVYYPLVFGLLILFLSTNIVLLVLVALLAIFHFAAYQKLVPETRENLLSKLTTRRVIGLFVFDVAELLVLVVLGMKLYPYVFSLVALP